MMTRCSICDRPLKTRTSRHGETVITVHDNPRTMQRCGGSLKPPFQQPKLMLRREQYLRLTTSVIEAFVSQYGWERTTDEGQVLAYGLRTWERIAEVGGVRSRSRIVLRDEKAFPLGRSPAGDEASIDQAAEATLEILKWCGPEGVHWLWLEASRDHKPRPKPRRRGPVVPSTSR